MVGLIAAIALVWFNRLAVYDWVRLRGYNPPQAIAQLANDTTMTNSTQHIFYVNRPEIQDKTEFNSSCPNNGGEKTIILGCYRSAEMGIYLYSVTDPQLKGVMQVTAAHEALHAAYDRLSSEDKANVDKLLQDFYKNDLKDKRIISIIAAYQKSEPNDVINEMHSVFGTEITKLTPALETYYKRHFKDRQKIVAYAQKYQSTFTNQKNKASILLKQIKSSEQRLSSLRTQIDNSESSLTNQYQSLLTSRKNSSAVEYNAKVDAYNAQVVAYKVLIGSYNQEVNHHNDLVSEYQNVTIETNQLYKKLDSRSATVSSQ